MSSEKIEELVSNAIIIINKPCGQASHESTTFVKKIVGAKRAGHAGTLDPNVSGVLPIALGRATKLLRYVACKNKTYIGIIKFRNIQSENEIKKLFEKFTGELIQTPPKQSAVKKVPRKRTVYSLDLLEISKENPRLVLFKTSVDAGTYIRTLCEDIGRLVGGARMYELRRIAVGRITEDNAFTMHDLVDAVWIWKNKNDDSLLRKMLRAPEEFISLSKVYIKKTALHSVLNGAQIMAPAIENIGNVQQRERVAIYSGTVFVGVGIMQIPGKEFNEKTRDMVIKVERIQMKKE